MFFILSKILEFLIAPLFWIIVLLIIAWINSNRKKQQKSFTAGLILLLTFTNPLLINTVMSIWEIKPYSIHKINKKYDVGIVMGGASRYYNSDTKRLVYGNGFDRVIQAVDLYRQNKIQKILITGGSGLVLMQNIKEADLLKANLLKMNIPDSDIIIERRSRNTYENVKMSSDILKSKSYGEKFLVITSAFHIRRTVACFAKQGIYVDNFPVDEHAYTRAYTPETVLLPDAGALNNWDLLLHEWIGVIVYRMNGYL